MFLDLDREMCLEIEQNFTNKASLLAAVENGLMGPRADVSRSVSQRLGAGNRAVQVQRYGWSQKTGTELLSQPILP